LAVTVKSTTVAPGSEVEGPAAVIRLKETDESFSPDR
jgi:hypothetical protein